MPILMFAQKETMDALPSEITSGEQRKTLDKDTVIKDFSHQVEEVTTKVEMVSWLNLNY